MCYSLMGLGTTAKLDESAQSSIQLCFNCYRYVICLWLQTYALVIVKVALTRCSVECGVAI
jgi:hypothetical protein